MVTPAQGLVPLSYLQTLTEAGRVSSANLNPGYTTLNGAVTNIATSVVVTSAAGFPAAGAYSIMIDAEQMNVTAGFGTTTWTVTRGTGGTTAAAHNNGAMVFQSATSLIPIEPVFFEPMVARYDPALMRNSFEKFYESMIVSQHSELKGIKAPATFETLTNWLSYAVKGGVTPTGVGPYTWAFTPTLTADDLAGLGAEMGNDTAAYHMAAMYCDQLVLEIIRGTDAATLTADFMGQQAFVMGAKTPGLTRTGLNMLNPALTATYLDTTTIGTTLVNDVASVKLTLKNGFQQLFFLNNVLYPTGVARPTRNMDIEIVKWFDDATELANAMNTVGNGVERKVRFLTTGPSGASLQADTYGYWDTMVFKVDKEIWHVTFTGRSVYDITATNSWSMVLVNSLATIP